jgi:hypothetical protein
LMRLRIFSIVFGCWKQKQKALCGYDNWEMLFWVKNVLSCSGSFVSILLFQKKSDKQCEPLTGTLSGAKAFCSTYGCCLSTRVEK